MDDSKSGYRVRLYRHYLITQLQADIKQVHDNLVHQAPYLRRLIQRWIPQDRTIRILDLGCGYGTFLYFLRESGYRNLEGIDKSPEQIAAARQLGLDCVQEGDALDILRKSSDSSYQIVIAFDVLEHFTKQEILAITDEVYRVLCPGGRFILHVPNGEAIFAGRSYFGDLTHETGFTRQSIRQLTSTVGFKCTYFSEDIPVIHGVASGIRHLLWKMFRTFFRLIYMAETGDMDVGLVLSQNMIAVAEK